MEKYKILAHLREVVGLNIVEFSSMLSMTENDVIAIEHGAQAISPKIINYYSVHLNIDLSIMDALFGDFSKSHQTLTYFQDITLYVLLKYLELGKWMRSFNET
jgi:hypothetical protein